MYVTDDNRNGRGYGMFMVHLTGIIEVVVPIAKCYQGQITLRLFSSHVKPEICHIGRYYLF